MSLRRSVLEHFVAPPAGPQPETRGTRPAEVAHRPGTPPAVGLLCRAADAQALGAALGLALAARHRAQVVVVCTWTGAAPAAAGWCAPPRSATRRLVANLAGRGHDARAAGRIAMVRLPADAGEAAGQARRVSAAAGAAPVVLALGGPRVAVFDELLAEQDLVVVATASGTDPALARLALAGLQAAAGRACVCEVPPARPARSLAAAGLTLLPSTRRALAISVEALS